MTTNEAVAELASAAGSLEVLAAEIGVSFHAIYSWCKGHRTPSRIHRVELAELAKRRGLPKAVIRALEPDAVGEART